MCIRYLEVKDHRINFEDSDSIRDLFKTKTTNILISFGNFAECCGIGETLSIEI